MSLGAQLMGLITPVEKDHDTKVCFKLACLSITPSYERKKKGISLYQAQLGECMSDIDPYFFFLNRTFIVAVSGLKYDLSCTIFKATFADIFSS